MHFRSVALALLCSVLSLGATNAEIIPCHVDLAPRQEASQATAAASSAIAAASTSASAVSNSGGGDSGVTGEGGSGGAGTGSTGSNGASGVNGAAGSMGVAAGPTTTSKALAGARATGDPMLWAVGVGAGLVGVVVGA